jgi:hypothetical protein
MGHSNSEHHIYFILIQKQMNSVHWRQVLGACIVIYSGTISPGREKLFMGLCLLKSWGNSVLPPYMIERCAVFRAQKIYVSAFWIITPSNIAGGC